MPSPASAPSANSVNSANCDSQYPEPRDETTALSHCLCLAGVEEDWTCTYECAGGVAGECAVSGALIGVIVGSVLCYCCTILILCCCCFGGYKYSKKNNAGGTEMYQQGF